MEPNVFTIAAAKLLLADLTAGTLTGAKIKLFVNDVDPGPNAVLADFTLASFTGAAPIVVSGWSEAFVTPDGSVKSLTNLAQFDWDSGADETVYGIVITTGADALLAYARFETPKQMSTTDDSLAVVAAVSLSPEGFGTGVRVA